jgi:hypothetical protein
MVSLSGSVGPRRLDLYPSGGERGRRREAGRPRGHAWRTYYLRVLRRDGKPVIKRAVSAAADSYVSRAKPVAHVVRPGEVLKRVPASVCNEADGSVKRRLLVNGALVQGVRIARVVGVRGRAIASKQAIWLIQATGLPRLPVVSYREAYHHGGPPRVRP